MNFLRYPSLVNHYAVAKERRIVSLHEKEWIATEKIHGSNASIVLDRDMNVGVAKRSTFITEDNVDKQFRRLLGLASEKQDMIDELSKFLDWDSVTQVHAFGEYFGGSVQRMDYKLCHDGEVDFKIFNVILEYEGLAHYVVSRETIEDYISNEYLVPIIKRGPLKQLMSEEPSEESLFGGLSEGRVYQPRFGYMILEDRFRMVGVKHKTEKFLEVEDVKVRKKTPELSNELLELIDDVGRYVTGARLDNVLSHGDLELKNENIGKIMLAYKEDVIKEYSSEVETSATIADLKTAVENKNRDIAMMIKNKIKNQAWMEL